ncbi:MFS general substrate transporter [Stereum hirsutum FP-91666 SS1]|uniref:MFS general substrate transporter n=1 Tax=Stereum hirsutum (strain FP-91666) TaxID=721885 RepID=UPI000440A6B0|nr:MFS general substrate transporter [Stereum hirsutum FP-91666 SS1]EIM87665.1 MFS general substrate transporter [Stereum hirsutum FP-91666 SS1]
MPMLIGTFLAATDATIVASSYASIGSELNQLQNTSWIATGYMLTLASFQPLYGKMSDIFGRKQCLLFSYVIFALGALWCGLARNMEELILARAFAGIGGGGMTTIVSIVLSDIIPLRSRGTWQGLLNICFATGSATGAPIGGILADTIGWRWAFLLQVPITVLAIISVSLALKLPSRDDSHWLDKLKRVDFSGALALVLCITSLLVGLDHGGNVSWTDRTAIISLTSFAVLLVIFAVIEFKLASEPFAPKRIVANTALLASYLCNFFCIASSMALIFHVAMYVQAVEHKSAAKAGMALIPGIVGGVAGSLIGGLIMQHTGRYYVLTAVSYFMMMAGTVLTALMTGAISQSFLGLEIGLIIMSLGNGSGITTTLIALIANAGAKDQAIATAVSYLFRSLGSVIGLSVGSTIFQNSLRKYLVAQLEGQNIDIDEIVNRVRESLDYVDQLDPSTRFIVRSSYEEALQACFWFTVALAVCAFLSSLFVKEKPLVKK